MSTPAGPPLHELIRQRDALSSQIEAAQRETGTDFAFGLEHLYDEIHRYARDHSLAISESQRKNVITVTIGDRISVAFAHDDGEHSAGLSVSTVDGTEIRFDGELPPVAALTGLLDGLRSAHA